ncbi:helix-turn-helix domain-containing protein [Sphaerimonospora sp. CA-214678]|uniref:helix-turn-helix domain-containing protein n=1 Tax=Sphaerimonospora sp. CA-214678 TaxID=3240029 RepID=UPI003D92F767
MHARQQPPEGAPRGLSGPGSIAGAARSLRLSPSAVSHQLARPEEDAGAVLVERPAHSLRLTAAIRAPVTRVSVTRALVTRASAIRVWAIRAPVIRACGTGRETGTGQSGRRPAT